VSRALLVLALSLALAGPAAAATIRGTALGEFVRGGEAADRIFARAGDDRIAAAFGGKDTVACGAGRDIVTADLTDRVEADCEIVSRRLSVDTTTNPASQHETAIEPDSFAYGSTVVAAFQVGRFEKIGAASAIGFAVSTNAGRTWRRGMLPSLTTESKPAGDQDRASDPSVAYDAVHGVWLVTSLTLGQRASSIFVSRSTDGLHWEAPVRVTTGPELDKEWIDCDNGVSSPFRDHCYAVYTDDALHRIFSQTSADGGLTWSPAVRVTGELIGAQPLVRPDGTLVVVVADLPDNRTGTIIAFRSTDGGATFGTPTRVSDVQWRSPDRMRAIPLPSAAVDAAGTLFVAWHDCRFRAGCSADDIVVSSSSDGTSWTPPVRIAVDSISSGVDHFITGLDADPQVPGRLALVYGFFEPHSCARGACRLEMGFTSSPDGGGTWTRQQRLDVESMSLDWLARASGGQMVGDYFSTSIAGGRAVPVFTLAAPPVRGRLREAIFGTSLPLS